MSLSPLSSESSVTSFGTAIDAYMADEARKCEDISRTFDIVLSRQAGVEESLRKLNKRATKKGLPLLSWSWGKAYTEETWLAGDLALARGVEILKRSTMTNNVLVRVVRVPLTIVGAAPRYNGWIFVAALQHLDGENIVRSVDGEEIPAKYRTSGPQCNHCKVSRRRNDTYVLRSTDGSHVQVGSTCIGDFLGSDDAGKIAAMASMIADACAIASSDDDYGGMGPETRLATDFLAYVAWEVSTNGWISRTAAREDGRTASADFGWLYLTDPMSRKKAGAAPSDEHAKLANDAAEWAENLSDAVVDAAKSDYLHNLRAAARTGIVTHRTAGIIGSTIIAYQNYLGKERLRKESAAAPKADIFVGNIKERITIRARLEFVTGYETAYGYTTVLKFRALNGALLVWKASSTDIGRDDAGKTFDLTGTVTKHDVYKNEKQTLVNRCKLAEVKA